MTNPTQSDSNPVPAELPTGAEIYSEKKIQRESLSFGGILAWGLVALVALAMIFSTAIFRSSEETRTTATKSDLMQVQLQARTVLGQKSWTGMSQSGAAVPDLINDGTFEQRLCYVILVNEGSGAEDAATKLVELDNAAAAADFEASEEQMRLRRIVGNLINSYGQKDFDATSVADEDRALLKEKLGWTGELALVPEGTSNKADRKALAAQASKFMSIMLGFMILVGLTLLTGFLIAAVFLILFATRTLKPEFKTTGKSVNIYIETFAIWLLLFFAGPTATVFAINACGIEITEQLNMLISVIFFFGSLIVLTYPVIRGLKFSQVMSDVGWKAKWGGIVDFFISPFSYIAGTPLMLCGLVCFFVLTLFAGLFVEPREFGTSVAAGHPIQEIIAEGTILSIGYVILMACIAAPIVEETMFRGVLYRHLRELTGTWAVWISVVFSAVFNGLIFAAIHPQGFTAIPLLTALAINFSLAREWRDSLVAPIIMHSINNSMVTILMLTVMT